MAGEDVQVSESATLKLIQCVVILSCFQPVTFLKKLRNCDETRTHCTDLVSCEDEK